MSGRKREVALVQMLLDSNGWWKRKDGRSVRPRDFMRGETQLAFMRFPATAFLGYTLSQNGIGAKRRDGDDGWLFAVHMGCVDDRPYIHCVVAQLPGPDLGLACA